MNMAVDFRATQQKFTQYIRNPDLNPAPADVKPERMAMYRELIFNNINGFLEGNFPVTRAILNDQQWHDLVQDFFVTHQARTPYFAEIAEEFLDYLENERDNPDDLPFLLELAHYEWVEMALSVATEDIQENQGITGNILKQSARLSPLAWPLIYRFPVQLISPDYLPHEPPGQPTCLIVYRNLDDEVGFIEINALTYRLLEIIQNIQPIHVGQVLDQIANETPSIKPELVIGGGLQTIQGLIEKNIVLISV